MLTPWPGVQVRMLLLVISAKKRLSPAQIGTFGPGEAGGDALELGAGGDDFVGGGIETLEFERRGDDGGGVFHRFGRRGGGFAAGNEQAGQGKGERGQDAVGARNRMGDGACLHGFFSGGGGRGFQGSRRGNFVPIKIICGKLPAESSFALGLWAVKELHL